MGVRAYGRETLASLPIDVDKNWNDRSISNVNSLQANEHITVTARGANRKLYPALNRYDSETDGWYVSKDNNDIERKFFKDEFSVDSSDNYTGHDETSKGFYTWDTANSKLVWQVTSITANQANIYNPITAGQYGISSVSFKCIDYDETYDQRIGLIAAKRGDTYVGAIIRRTIDGTNRFVIFMGNWEVKGGSGINIAVDFFDGATYTITVETTSTGINGKVYREGVYVTGYTVPYAEFANFTPPTPDEFVIGFGSQLGFAKNITCEVYDLSFKPTISYADDFSTDTVTGADGRYQAITGSNAYDDANKWMTVTAGAGVTAKTRLKSYKQLEGSYKKKLHLPATGTDGDVVASYFGTKPTLTTGFGVGAIRTSGAWNIATIHGATVTDTGTVIPDLADGDSFYVEVERDTRHGVVWYYVYETTKPTEASGKLFNVHQEVYDGVWFKNNGAAENSIAVSEIEDRAESIVGRTNVQVEEPFWFRDEFWEDSSGRYVTSGTGIYYDGENNEYYVSGRNGIYITDLPTFIGETIVTIQTRNTGVTTECYPCVVFGEPKKIYNSRSADNFIYGNPTLCVWFSTNGVHVFQNGASVPGATSTAIKYQSGETQTFVVTYNGSNQITVSDGTNSITFTDAAFAVRTVFSAFIGTYSSARDNGLENRFKLIEISGTRVYNKPIHRGAMLEIYHDETQEVVGTTFIDDCQWDRSAEYTSSGLVTRDTTNGKISITSSGGYAKINSLDCGDGYYEFVFSINHLTDARPYLQICGDSLSPSFTEGNRIVIFAYNTYIRLFGIVGGVSTEVGIMSSGLATGTQYRVGLLKVGDVVHTYLNGEYKSSLSGVSALQGNVLVGCFSGTEGVNIHSIRVIAASPDASNGIAACIPLIGGGARFGEQEKIYKQLVNTAKFGEYKTTALVKTTNASAEAIEMYFKNTTDNTNIATDDTDTLAISLADTNYAMLTKDLQLLHRDRADTIEVAVRASSAATPVSPSCYITDLMILPKTEG